MKYKGIVPAFVHPPHGMSELFMRAMHNSYKAGVFQHDYTAQVGSRPNAARTRNGEAFLKSNAEYIFLVDTDMVWEPSDIIKLKQFAKEHDVKAVSGWALAMRNGMWPNAYRWDGTSFVPWGEIDPFGVPLKVDGVGGSNFLVHRDVYEEVADATRGTTQFLWQDDEYVPEIEYNMGEDLVFCKRIREYTDYDIWYHPDAIFTHVKPTPYGPKEYMRFISGLRKRVNGHLYPPNIQPTNPEQAG